MAALYSLVNNAQTTIDMTMYALNDTTFSTDLVNACKRGVKVRVVLDQNSEKSQDTPAYNQLNAQTNCSAVWANKAFNVTHEKSFIVDGTQMALMSLNLQTAYYATTRDAAMIYNDPVDIAAVQATFNADFAAGTPPSGTAGASDFSYQPSAGNDLIWSPTTAQVNMENVIKNAKTSLVIDAEELTSSASYIVTDIANACKNGVAVRFTLENESGEYNTQLATLKAAGCVVHYYSSSTGFYVHLKAVVADYGLSTQKVYMGSINYSNASMNSNRELGMYITDNASVQTLYTALVSDYTNATGVY
jgi:phosphatidylserine/phosphatidylglycerophosphate/cardiolipin synthase-like enzyme